MSNLNGMSAVPDLGAMRARQQAKASTPPYDPGTPEITLQVGTELVNGQPSFTDSIDKTAVVLGADGWSIVEVKQCAVVAVDPQQGAAIVQVIVVARRAAQ